MKRRVIIICSLLLIVGLSACAQFYEITDLQTREIYYATGSTVERTYTGQVVFWDAKTGYQVSLSSWKLRDIPKEHFDAALEHENPDE